MPETVEPNTAPAPISMASGADQTGVRLYNERLIFSLARRFGTALQDRSRENDRPFRPIDLRHHELASGRRLAASRGAVDAWTPRSPSSTRKTLGSFGIAPGEPGHDAAKARRDGHRVVELDRLGIGVIGIAARLEHLAEDALLPRLGEDLAGRQVVAGQGDPDADLVARHDELRR